MFGFGFFGIENKLLTGAQKTSCFLGPIPASHEGSVRNLRRRFVVFDLQPVGRSAVP